MNATVLETQEPVLDEPRSPASPPVQPSNGDRELALAWIMGGKTSAWMAARAADESRRAAFRSPEADGELARELAEYTVDWAAKHARLAFDMAVLEAEGWTREAARDAIRATGGTAAGALREPWQTPNYCSACHPNHPGPCGCRCHLPAAATSALFAA